MKASLYAVAGLFVLMTTHSPAAVPAVYTIDRSFSLGTSTATLVGTLEIPLGSYTIENMGPSPFTGVDLTLTVNGTSYAVNNVLTDLINGGQFFINATSTGLIFNTANASGANPADLCFSDITTSTQQGDRYIVGYNGVPGFEAAYTSAGTATATATLPLVFGVAVPEPSPTLMFGCVAVAVASTYRIQRSNRVSVSRAVPR